MSGEPASSAAGGIAAWKLGAALLGVGVVASAIGFFVLWPKTVREGVSRIAATILGSAVFGPAAAIAAFHRFPEMFNAAVKLATQVGLDPLAGWMAACAPWMVLSGLPVWWVGGAIARWFEKRKGKDIEELASDAKRAMKGAVS